MKVSLGKSRDIDGTRSGPGAAEEPEVLKVPNPPCIRLTNKSPQNPLSETIRLSAVFDAPHARLKEFSNLKRWTANSTKPRRRERRCGERCGGLEVWRWVWMGLRQLESEFDG